MAQLTINLPNNETASIPDWKLDTEIENMAKAMTMLSRTMEKDNAKLLKAITGGTGNNSTANNASNNTKDKNSKKEQTEETKKATKEIGKFRGGLALGAGVVTNALGGLAVGLQVAIAGLTSLTVGTLFEFGSSLNKLTAVGLNQGDQFLNNNFLLRTFGMSLEQATDFTINASNAMQNIGMKGVTNLLKEFDALTLSGSKFGLTLVDNRDIFREELKFATRMGNLNRLDERQRKEMIRVTSGVLDTQILYTQALGENLETIRAFALQTLEGSTDFQARLLLSSEATRQTMLRGAQEFVSVLRATGGTLGGELAAAAVEAGSFGAIGFSEAAKRFITVLPSLASGFNNVVRGFSNDVLDGEEAALTFTKILGNLSDSERRRVFAIARTGDQQALVMAKGIMQFEKSFDRIQKLSTAELDPNQIQTTLNLLNVSGRKMIETLTGVRDKFILSFVQGLDYDKFNKAFGDMQRAVTDLAYTLFGFTKETEENGKKIEGSGGIITRFAEALPVLIGKFTANVDLLSAKVKKYFDGGKDLTDVFSDLLFPSFKELMSFLGFEFGILMKEMMMRVRNATKFFPKDDEEMEADINEMREKKRFERSHRLTEAQNQVAQGYINQRDQYNAKNSQNAYPDGFTPGQVRASHYNQPEYPKAPPGIFELGNTGQVYNLGSDTLSKEEQKRLKNLLKSSNPIGSLEMALLNDKFPSIGLYKKPKLTDIERKYKELEASGANMQFDADKSGTLEGEEVKALMKTLIQLTRKQSKIIEKTAE